MATTETLVEGQECPSCAAVVQAPGHACHAIRDNYAVAPVMTKTEVDELVAAKAAVPKTIEEVIADDDMGLTKPEGE